MTRIVILASGSGSNAENIVKYFENSNLITVNYILCNKKDAKVFERAHRLNVQSMYFDKKMMYESDTLLNFLKEHADYIILAGFLWKVPANIIEAFPNKIINIHPALLPKYGGKGMYGMHVHTAVVANQETETGITIHYVNEQYDEGAIIFQDGFKVLPTDTADDVAHKIHELEYNYFPKIIETVILKT